MLLAQSGEGFEELLAEPTLLIGTVLLIVVSVGWILVARSINRAIRQAALAARRRAVRRKRKPPPPPDNQIWDYPP